MFRERAMSNFMLSSNNALSVLLYGIDLMRILILSMNF